MFYVYNTFFIICDYESIEEYFKFNDCFYIKLKDCINIYKKIKEYYCNTLIYISKNIDYKILDKCLKNNINIQFSESIIKYINNNYLTLYKSSLNEIESNLLIESIDIGYPIYIHSDDIILYKCKSSLDFCKYYKYILDYSVSKYNNNKLYFYSFENNFLKLQIHLCFFKNKIIILEIFKYLYLYLQEFILFVDYKFNKNKYNEIYNLIKNIIENLNITNIICSIYLIYQNNNFYFYDIKFSIDINKYFLYYKDIYNINIFDIFFETNFKNFELFNNKYIKYYNNFLIFNCINFCNNEYIKINNNFKCLLNNIIDNSNKIDIHKTYIKNINLKYNLCKIYNNIINLKKPEYCIDTYNSKLSNYIINNKINETIIENNNNISLYFYNKTNICITGKDVQIFINSNKINTYKIIKINKFDLVNIINNTINYYYISISNGIKSYNKCKSKNELIFNKTKNNFNINNIIPPNYDNIYNFIIDKNKYKYIFSKYKWHIYKINNDIIIFKTKNIFNVFNEKTKFKKFKYPIGSIILNNNYLHIIRNNNFDYFKGIYLGCIIYTNIWKLNFIDINDNIIFNDVSYDFARFKINSFNSFLNNIILNNDLKESDKKNEYLFNYEDNKITLYSKLYGDNYIIVIYKNKNIIYNLIRIKLIMNNFKIINGNNFYIFKINNILDKDIKNILNIEKNISINKNILLNIINTPLLIKNNNINININDFFIIIEIYKNKIYIKNNNKTIFYIYENKLFFNNKIIGYVIINNNYNILDLIKFNNFKEDIFNSILYNYNIKNYYFNIEKKKFKIDNIINVYN